MRRLNAQDDRWLAIDTPENPYQIGALLFFETNGARRPEDFDAAVRAHFERRLVALVLQTHHALADGVGFQSIVRRAMQAELERSDLMRRLTDRDDRPFGARHRRARPEEGTAAGNVSVSNVPGPDAPRFLAGYRMLANHPAPNLPAGQLLNVTLRRYLDVLDFGLVACPDIVPDLAALRAHFVTAFEELRALAP